MAPSPPGDDLRSLISQGRHDGRPAWRLGPNIAPRIEYVAIHDPQTGEPVLDRPLAVDLDRRPYFSQRLLLWLETRNPTAYDQLGKHDRAKVLLLVAAIERDLHGQSYDEIADGLRYTKKDNIGQVRVDGEHAARRAVRRGRKLWPRLCAWPWCYWGPDGKPPAGWREQGADPTLAAAFNTWATGEPHLLDEGRAA